jgi:tRNA modification GTPase
MSGPKALEIAQKVFVPKLPPQDLPSRRVRYGHIVDPETGELIDEVLLVYMKAPWTYTREDVVEISGHGGYLVLSKILELLVKMGARPALPGEFTKRAFLNGRIDLAQAEAVLELILAQNEQALRLAQRQLEGVLSDKVKALKDRLFDLLVPISAWLEVPEEDIPAPSKAGVLEGIEAVLKEIEGLLRSWEQNVIFREGVRTCLLGKANVGKSSLFNRLLGRDRAIVTPIPGTTSDVIEETVLIDGIPFCLVDMAGFKKKPKDLIEEEAIRRAKLQIERADLILFVLDHSSPLEEEDLSLLEELEGKRAILVLNKSDLPPFPSKPPLEGFEEVVKTSALTGEGIEELKEKMVSLIKKASSFGPPSEVVPLNTRHKTVLERARGRLISLKDHLEELPWDQVALELEGVMDDLGEVIGESASEEVLEEIFSRFCVGK